MNPETFDFLEKSLYNTSNDGWVDVSSYDINYIDDRTKNAVSRMYKDFFSDDIYKSRDKQDDAYAVGDMVWYGGKHIAVITAVCDEGYTVAYLTDSPIYVIVSRDQIRKDPGINTKSMIVAFISEIENSSRYPHSIVKDLTQRLSTM